MIRLNQVFKIFLILFVSIIICFKSYSDTLKTHNDLVVLGKNEAPIKIKIFSSFTCPHCANFHINVVPKIKKEYVDLDKVQLIFIDFPLDQAAFNASKLLHCLDQKKQITFLDKIYENQSQWNSGQNLSEINNNLKEIVKVLGINSKEFDKCLNNDIIVDQIINGRIDAIQKYSINSTPTIIINEKKLEGSPDFRNIKKK